MCDLDPKGREWRFYVQDMIEFAEAVLSYTEGLSQQGFIADRRTYDAAMRNIELMGEAASHIPGVVRDMSPEIEWRTIIGTRNRLAHAYLGIDDDVVWDIVQTDIPDLLPKLRRLLEPIGP